MSSKIAQLEVSNNELKDSNQKLLETIEFYQSIFKSHSGSVVYNLHIKTINGKHVWVDPICDNSYMINSLDKDDEVLEWLAPVRPSR